MHSMYSGSDSTESQKYTQWALNPSTYQNMANDQVDWAALAQQWIIMKEAGPPPIPGEQPIALKNRPPKVVSEAGEAPMEVENDKEEAPAWNVSEPPPPPGAEAWNWNPQSQSWNWNNSWVQPSGVPPPPTIGPMKSALLPTPNNMYSAPPESTSDNAVPFGGYNAGGNNEYNSAGYWTGPGNHKHIKPHNKRYSKVNVPIRAVPPIPPVPVPLENTTPPALDAAKRKQLPAWIREGLEKMEKDKLKQLEKEREKQVQDEFLQKNKQNEKETMEILKSTMKERQRSKFESDGENSDTEEVRKKTATPDPVPLTQDELMLKVRRLMTEVLLNVTTRQIEAICKEEHQRFLKKYKASSDHRSTAPSGANVSARLGLGMYGDGSGSSSDEDDDDAPRNDKDSDSELKDTIKRKIAEFQKTEREIEEKLEEAERRKAGSASRSSTPESVDNDSQVDARGQGRKHHADEKSPPRSRNPHDKPRTRSFSSSSGTSNYSNNRSKNSRRSSSSDSNDSHKKSKKKHRSRSRSRSPDKKHHQSSVTSRWSRSRSPSKRHSRSDSMSRRDSNGSRKKSSRRSRSRSYSRSRRSRSSSYRKNKRSRSRSRSRGRSRRSRSRDRSASRNRFSKRTRSRSRSNGRRGRRRRSRSSSSGRGKRSHRH